jgi:type IV secretion system protein TrbF
MTMALLKYKGAVSYKGEGSNTTPYNSLKNEFDDLVGETKKERNAWRIAAFISIAAAIVSIGGWFWVAGRPASIPYVIEISSWGEAKYVGEIGTAELKRPDESIKFYLNEFVANIRKVSTDKYVVNENLNKSFKFVTSTAANILKRMLNENDPFSRAEKERVDVVVDSIIHITKDAWQVDWLERVFTSEGMMKGSQRYRGIFSLYFTDPTKEQQNLNPLGIFIDDFEIQQLKKEEGGK